MCIVKYDGLINVFKSNIVRSCIGFIGFKVLILIIYVSEIGCND